MTPTTPAELTATVGVKAGRPVALLIAAGRSNRQIADELTITERTAEAHVGHILEKLEFTSRTQIGVWVAARATASLD